MNKLMTEQSVKDVLGISDWRNLSKDKIMSFVSVLPDVDSEVAIKIIEQFPEYAKTSQEMVNCMKETCSNILSENKSSSDKSMQAYKQILDNLEELLKKENITLEEKEYLLNKMIEVADKISDKDTENKTFLGNALKTVGGVALGALMIGALFLGAKEINNNNSNNPNNKNE